MTDSRSLLKFFDGTTNKVQEAAEKAKSILNIPMENNSKSLQTISVIFSDKKLGLTLQRGVFSGRPVVVSIEKGSSSFDCGVSIGDEIIQIQGEPNSGFPTTCIEVDSYDKFMKLFPKNSRPIKITFYHPIKPSYIKQQNNMEKKSSPNKKQNESCHIKNEDKDLEDIELKNYSSSSYSDDNNQDHIDSSNMLIATAAAQAASTMMIPKQQNNQKQQQHKNRIQNNDNDDEDNQDNEEEDEYNGILKKRSAEELKEEIKTKALNAAITLKQQGKEIEEKIKNVKEKFSFWIEKTKDNLTSTAYDENDVNDNRFINNNNNNFNHTYYENNQSYHDPNQNYHDNDEIRELKERMKIDNEIYEMERIKEQSKRQWKNLTLTHLERFIIINPKATYEDWLCDIYPKMTSWKNSQGIPDSSLIDEHFYQTSSDYLGLWNKVSISRQKETSVVPVRGSDVFQSPCSNALNPNNLSSSSSSSLSSSSSSSTTTSSSLTFQHDNSSSNITTSYDLNYDLNESYDPYSETHHGSNSHSLNHNNTHHSNDHVQETDYHLNQMNQGETAAELARQVSDALSLAFADDSDDEDFENDAFMM